MTRSFSMNRAAARRIALHAQGFGRARPEGRVDRRHLRRALRDMGIVQIDSVNVLVRSQELPLFARLGAHRRTLIEEATADRELFETWVHEACHVPVELHPYLRYRMQAPHRWRGLREFAASNGKMIAEVKRTIEQGGPVTAAELEERTGPKQPWWDWTKTKSALAILFQRGEIAVTKRGTDFAREFDLTERVLPPSVLEQPTPSEADQRKELLVLAARHHGIGTLEDLTDYHRQRNPPCRCLVEELIEDGRLLCGSVEGWSKPALMHPQAIRPRAIRARALLSPFDPVVWCRDRAERIFGFSYRIEIYVPKHKRQHGYYVLPFLLGDR